MATTTEAAPSKDEAGQAKDGGRKKMVMIGLVAVVAAAAVYMLVLKPKDAAAAAAPPKPKPGAVVKLEPITINLAAGHFLKLGLSLQASADAGEDVSGAKALDTAIGLFSGKHRREPGQERRPGEGQDGADQGGRRSLRGQGLRHLLHRLRHAVTAAVPRVVAVQGREGIGGGRRARRLKAEARADEDCAWVVRSGECLRASPPR